MYKTKADLHQRVAEHYKHLEDVCEKNELGEVFGVFLEGSQNYVDELFFPDSDVDTVAVVMPSKRNLLLGNMLPSKEYKLENGELTKVYDAREFFKKLKKSGLNSQQTLYTEYFKVNEKYKPYYEQLVLMREEVSLLDKKRVLMNVYGLAFNQVKLLKNSERSHERYLKTFANVLRMEASMYALLENATFEKSLKALDENEVFAVRKTNKYSEEKYSHEELTAMMDTVVKDLKEKAEQFPVNKKGPDPKVLEKLEQVFCSLLMASMEK